MGSTLFNAVMRPSVPALPLVINLLSTEKTAGTAARMATPVFSCSSPMSELSRPKASPES
jgi:hypothetical protein